MKKKVLIFLGLLISFLLMIVLPSGFVLAQEINWAAGANDATAEKDLGTVTIGCGDFKTPDNCIICDWYDSNVAHGIDETRDDYCGGGHREHGRQSWMTYTINFFTVAPVINTLIIDYIVASAEGGEQRKLELWDGSEWIVISENDAIFPATTYYNGEASAASDFLIGKDERATINGPWYNISKIKIFLYCPPHDKNSEYAAVFNVEAWGLPPSPPCEHHNVRGWAWSENIGWLSFSCENNVLLGTGVDYGVDIDEVTGLFSGYAWSENIGWISFDGAQLDLSTGAVSGWARALAYGGGWDGWIKLSGTWADGVSVIPNASPPPESVFNGWAWGDVVVGWISFNCSNTDYCTTQVDYKVMTDIVINSPPYVEPGSTNIQYEEYCDFSPFGRIGFEWTYQDDDGDNQAQYNLQVATDAGEFSILVVDVVENPSAIPPGSKGTSAVSVKQTPDAPLDIAYGDTYFWRVKVKDIAGKWSTDWEEGPSFSTPSNPYPNPSFTWNPTEPPAEVEVTFTDSSICYTGVDNCKDDADTSYEWDFEYDGSFDPIDWTKGDTVYTYSVSGPYTVRLGVTDIIDGIPRTCYQEEDLTATLPLPTWKEIVPF